MGLYVLPLSPNNFPTTAQGPLGVVEGRPKITIFHPTHAGMKMAKSSPVGPYGGTDLENLEIAPRTPFIRDRVQIQAKNGTGLGLNRRTVATFGQPPAFAHCSTNKPKKVLPTKRVGITVASMPYVGAHRDP